MFKSALQRAWLLPPLSPHDAQDLLRSGFSFPSQCVYTVDMQGRIACTAWVKSSLPPPHPPTCLAKDLGQGTSTLYPAFLLDVYGHSAHAWRRKKQLTGR